jgi:hypothetical protein
MPDVRTEVARLLDEQDSFAAVQFIVQQGTPPDVMRLFGDVAQWLYSARKDVAGMIAVTRAGIQFGLSEAARSSGHEADQLRGSAKALAFNLASNTWPGWQDAGITLTESDRHVGLDAAKLNLRLAIELRRDDLPLCNAHWILGAQQLADGQLEPARAAFARAAEHAQAAGRPEFVQMSRGYAAMTEVLAQPNGAVHREFDECVAELRQLDTDDSRFFADQLESVLAYFAAERQDAD